MRGHNLRFLFLAVIAAAVVLLMAGKQRQCLELISIEYFSKQYIAAVSNVSDPDSRALRYASKPGIGTEERGIGSSLKNKLYDSAFKWALKFHMNPKLLLYLLNVPFSHPHAEMDRNFGRWIHYVIKFESFQDEAHRFSESTFYKLLETKLTTEDMAMLFQSLETWPDGERLAGKMQAYMILNAPSRDVMHIAWNRVREPPEHVFRILNLENETIPDRDRLITEWLRYCRSYRETESAVAFQGLRIPDELFYSELLRLLRKTKADEDIIAFLQSIRNIDGMETFTDHIEAVADRTLLTHEILLKRVEHPETFFNRLHLQNAFLAYNSNFLKWLSYIAVYNKQPGIAPFTMEKAFEFIRSSSEVRRLDLYFGEFLEAKMKDVPELKEELRKMQIEVFKYWRSLNIKPLTLWNTVNVHKRGRLNTPEMKNSFAYRSIQSYTKYFAQHLDNTDVSNKVLIEIADGELYKASKLASGILEI
ncbi:hypothetical protein CCR75_003408 [Bremia lactucae]|uniref:RXLR phytopathogen effector protein WY-domain domain-containing protein n=1 Tax=Bremia lactucae TaxID=4779 RepID=A0A976IID1_BRELC|nr:hypothetical protein CCR75_003408 [Bremia lactucae]